MNFWVYENWTIDKAIVHKATCSYCNDGAGIHRDSSHKNSEWHGPFSERGDAFKKADDTKRKDIRGCKSCAP